MSRHHQFKAPISDISFHLQIISQDLDRMWLNTLVAVLSFVPECISALPATVADRFERESLHLCHLSINYLCTFTFHLPLWLPQSCNNPVPQLSETIKSRVQVNCIIHLV